MTFQSFQNCLIYFGKDEYILWQLRDGYKYVYAQQQSTKMYNRIQNRGGLSQRKRIIMKLFIAAFSITSLVFIILILTTPNRISSAINTQTCWDFCDRDFDYNGRCCDIFQVNCIDKEICRTLYIQKLQTQRTVFLILTCIFIPIDIILIYCLKRDKNPRNPPVAPIEANQNQNPYILVNPSSQNNIVNNKKNRKVDDDYESFVVESKDVTCAICLECFNAQEAIMLKCGHIFHSRCIRDWAVKQENCPVCRASH